VNLEEHDNDEIHDSMKSVASDNSETEEFDVQPMIQSITQSITTQEDELIMTKATSKVEKKEDVKIVDNFM
jgi:hypothetical protein